MKNTRLEELRENRDIKAKEIANTLSIAESTYSQWENDKIPIPTRRIVQLSNYYKINIDYMFKLTDKKREIKSHYKIDLKLIGNNLKEIRNDLNVSLREIGTILNTSFSAFASYERGEHLVQSHILIDLSKNFGYSVDWILFKNGGKYIKEHKF